MRHILLFLVIFFWGTTAFADTSWTTTTNFYIGGSSDPTLTAVNALKGTYYFKTDGNLFVKLDDGSSTHWSKITGSGGVTSVAMTVPSFLSVSGSPVTTTGTLAISSATAAVNMVLAGPVSGGSGPLSIRALAPDDLKTGGTNGQCLQSNGSGLFVWGSCGGAASGPSGAVQLSDGSGNLTNSPKVVFDGASYLNLGNGAGPSGIMVVSSSGPPAGGNYFTAGPGDGAIVQGNGGSHDFTVTNSAGNNAIMVAHGTTNLEVVGNIKADSNINMASGNQITFQCSNGTPCGIGDGNNGPTIHGHDFGGGNHGTAYFDTTAIELASSIGMNIYADSNPTQFLGAGITASWVFGTGTSNSSYGTLTLVNEHLKSTTFGSVSPTASPTANAGSTGTCVVSHATDLAGIVTITAGGIGLAAGDQCTITFTGTYGAQPVCTIIPIDQATALFGEEYAYAPTTAAFIIGLAASPTAGTYKYSYHCIETF